MSDYSFSEKTIHYPVQRKQTFKVGLIGYPGVGKTCLLSALASEDRIKSKEGWSADWVPANHDDNEWITGAIENLRNGRLPKSTPVSRESTIYKFRLVNPDNRESLVEIIDYPGELIRIEHLGDIRSQHLTNLLIEAHGLIILAEAPLHSGTESSTNRYLRAIVNHVIEPMAYSCPLALVVNKWDRVSVSNLEVCAKEEQEKLKKLLENQLQSKEDFSLLQELYGALDKTAKAKGLPFEVFPLSALGECFSPNEEGGDGLEKPKAPQPLKSFGWAQPLDWMISERADIDLKDYEKQIRQLSPWIPLLSSSLFQRIEDGRRLAERMPDADRELEAYKMFRTFRSILVKKLVLSAVILFLVPIMVFLSSEYVLDRTRIISDRMFLINQGKYSMDVRQAQLEALQIAHSPAYRHMLFKLFHVNSGMAENLALDLQERLEKRHWTPVEQISKDFLKKKAEQATLYLRALPNGQHNEEAIKISEEYERKLKTEENDQELLKLERLVATSNIDSDLENLQGKLSKLPFHIDFETPEQRERKERIKKRLDTYYIERKQKKFWKDYDTCLESKNIMEMATLLSGGGLNLDQLEELRKKFKEKWAKETAISKIIEYEKEGNYKGAREELKKLDNLPVFAEDICPQDWNIILNGLQRKIDLSEDKRLYDKVRKHPDRLDTLKRYLKHSPLKTMKKYVELRIQYLEQMDKKQKLTLVVKSIRWGPHVSDEKDNHVRVWGDDVLVFEKMNIRSRPNQEITNLKSFYKHRFHKRPQEGIKIEVKILDQANWWLGNGTDVGSGKFIEKCISFSKTLCKSFKGEAENQCEVCFHIEGLPEPTELPEWRE